MTVTALPVAPDRVTVKGIDEPSFAEAAAIESEGCVSMFATVPVALAVPSTTPDEGEDSVAVMVKFAVDTWSSIVGTASDCDVTPAANDSVPLVAV